MIIPQFFLCKFSWVFKSFRVKHEKWFYICRHCCWKTLIENYSNTWKIEVRSHKLQDKHQSENKIKIPYSGCSSHRIPPTCLGLFAQGQLRSSFNSLVPVSFLKGRSSLPPVPKQDTPSYLCLTATDSEGMWGVVQGWTTTSS